MGSSSLGARRRLVDYTDATNMPTAGLAKVGFSVFRFLGKVQSLGLGDRRCGVLPYYSGHLLTYLYFCLCKFATRKTVFRIIVKCQEFENDQDTT